MQKLKNAIVNQDALAASLIVASRLGENLSEDTYLSEVDTLTNIVKDSLTDTPSNEARFRQIVSIFYKKLAFSGDERNFFASKYSLLNEVIDYRTGIPVTLSILFCHIATKLGLEVYGVNFPGHFLVRFQASKERALFLDPLNGTILNWQELEALYFSIIGELDEEEMPEEALYAAKTEEIVIRLLQNLKAAFIKEEKYSQALATVEMLVAFNPDDPYERKDRGYLLHQMECPQLALQDYQYFIKQCPQDPSAQLLKLQLRRFKSAQSPTLH
ncbi:tetratricopeptide repeat protein [Aestuariibacter sp. AA17]|uniref:Tetratricopeptide repeat protein n=1 Tax=Fluctibacter corallii TaxID=2984329 RepID=A0ABT3ADB7_9ALTE|nr:tetratricopeptide repeat protein [Aestuariibacter sp. AA17]MCV2886661.1 tetratricopeptide repeat protein [Aestuariibacter sp. AA17]